MLNPSICDLTGINDKFKGEKSKHSWKLFGTERVFTFDYFKSRVIALKQKKIAPNEEGIFSHVLKN